MLGLGRIPEDVPSTFIRYILKADAYEITENNKCGEEERIICSSLQIAGEAATGTKGDSGNILLCQI